MRADELRPVAPALEIVPMRRRHLRSIIRIQAQHAHAGWSIGLWLAELRREHDRLYAVALDGRQVVGYAGMLFQFEDAHITTIGVDDRVQGHAVASRMMLVLARIARRRGAQNITLEVRASNDAAIRLYRRFGLAPAGIRKDYYKDLHEDALIMWAHEIDGLAYADRLDRIERELRATGIDVTPVDQVLATAPSWRAVVAPDPFAGPTDGPDRDETEQP